MRRSIIPPALIASTILCLCVLPNSACADYGFIRVSLTTKDNPDHDHAKNPNYSAFLYANGVRIGPTFSHSNFGQGSKIFVAALSVQHLNSKQKKTAITDSYPSFSRTQCEFDFQIEFSFLRDGPWIPLGTFRAPKAGNSASIPIGFCGGEKAVCSDDIAIQTKINRQYNLAKVAAYNEWKKEYDNRVKQATKGNEETLARAEKEMSERSKPNPDEHLEHKVNEGESEQTIDEALAREGKKLSEDQLAESSLREQEPADLATGLIREARQSAVKDGGGNGNRSYAEGEALGGTSKAYLENKLSGTLVGARTRSLGEVVLSHEEAITLQQIVNSEKLLKEMSDSVAGLELFNKIAGRVVQGPVKLAVKWNKGLIAGWKKANERLGPISEEMNCSRINNMKLDAEGNPEKLELWNNLGDALGCK